MLKKFLFLLAALFCFATQAQAAPKHIQFDEKNVVVLRGEIGPKTVAKTAVALLENPNKDVYLYIASPGGSITAGMELADIIRNSGKNVKCVAGFAASMAFAILQACNERYVLDRSVLMQHVPHYSLEGDAPNNWSMVQFIHRMIKKLDEDQAKRLGLKLEDFRAKTRDDWWLFGDEAVEAKAADAVVTASCTQSLTKRREKEKMRMLFWTFTIEWSGCPLIESPVKIEAEELSKKKSKAKSEEYQRFIQKLNVQERLIDRRFRTRA